MLEQRDEIHIVLVYGKAAAPVGTPIWIHTISAIRVSSPLFPINLNEVLVANASLQWGRRASDASAGKPGYKSFSISFPCHILNTYISLSPIK